MSFVSSAQAMILLVLGIAALGLELYAFVDALRRRPDAFEAAGKRTKNFWLLLTGVALLVGFVTVMSVLNMFGLIAVVAAGVYLADVKPALDQVTGRGQGSQGPYGPW
ncbi:MAG: DUF2516 family protein [Phycicoccus sp.]|nr:DUF2516 family protein [Phycicoccus sp.]